MQRIDSRFNRVDQNELERVSSILEAMGMLSPHMGGIQLDVMVAQTKIDGLIHEAGFCDHNCRIETDGEITGSYDCNMATSLRPGRLGKSTLASANDITFLLSNAVNGLKLFNQDFMHMYIDKIAEMAELSVTEVAAFINNLKQNRIILNLFGGNPELHPQIFEIIKEAKMLGLEVNLTTTGGMFMNDTFAENFFANPTDIALSADDFENPQQIAKLLEALEDKEAFKQTWLNIPFNYGQKRKALESIYAAHRISEYNSTLPPENRIKILFNLVIHSGNLDAVCDLIDALNQAFPEAEVNAFPAQSSFYNGAETFRIADIPRWEYFIDRMIFNTLNSKSGIIKKLHYWMLLKSAFNVYRNDPQRLIFFLSGFGSWTCYSEVPGAGRFLQIGSSSKPTETAAYAGGHLNCFWDKTTIEADLNQVDMLTDVQISTHIAHGAHLNSIANGEGCTGCLFPRLNALDELTLVAGMNPELQNEYVRLRNSILKSE